MIKNLKSVNIKMTPFNGRKDWSLSNVNNDDVLLTESGDEISLEYVDYGNGSSFPTLNKSCNISLEQQSADEIVVRDGERISGLFYPDTDPTNFDGTYKRVIYTQIQTMFYNTYRDQTKMWGLEVLDFEAAGTEKFLSNNIKVYNIPKNIFGEKIAEKSITIYDNTLDNVYAITDDGKENLFAGPNLFSKVQEVGDFENIFLPGNHSGCEDYFNSIGTCSAPTGLSASITASVLLTWDDNSTIPQEDGFAVERSNNSGSTYTLLQYTNTNESSSHDTTVVLGATYWYRVYAFNSFGNSGYSNTASIIIPSNVPTIVSQPQDVTAYVGDGVTFNVTASGYVPLFYQWQFTGSNLVDGGKISGSNTSTLTVGNITSSNDGNYRVLVNNILGGITSSNAALSVLISPLVFPMYAWFKADDLSYVAEGDLIGTGSATWYATSSVLFTPISASQIGLSASSMPTYKKNVFGTGHNGVTFDGFNDHLFISPTLFPSGAVGLDKSYMIAFKGANKANNVLLGSIGDTSRHISWDTGLDNKAHWSDGFNTPASRTLSSSLSQSKALGWSISGTQIDFLESNYSRGSGIAGGALILNIIGSSKSGSFLSGSILEICIWSASVSTSSMKELYTSYFQRKYPEAHFYDEAELSASTVFGLSVTNWGLYTASLVWSGITPYFNGVSGYYIYRSDNSGSSYNIIASGSLTSYHDITVQASSSYIYKIQAHNPTTVSIASITASLDTPSEFGPDNYPLYAWWKADDLNLSQGQVVGTGSAWWYATSSINTHHSNLYAYQTDNSTKMPTYKIDDIGVGSAAVKFDGIDDFLSMSMRIPIVTTTWTVAMVFRSTTVDSMLLGFSGSNEQFRTFGNGNNVLGFFDGVITTYSRPLSTSVSMSKVGWWQRGEATNGRFLENKYQAGNMSLGAEIMPIDMIGRTSFGANLSGSIAEICIWTGSAVTTSVVDALFDNYFFTKYPNAGFYVA